MRQRPAYSKEGNITTKPWENNFVNILGDINQISIWLQSGWCYRKTLAHFPSTTEGKTLGIIPEVFVNELLGNNAPTLQEGLLFWIDMFLIC